MNMRLFCGFATILRSVRCIRWTNNSCRLKSISSCSLFPPLTFINFHQRKASFLSLFFYTWMKLDCSFLSSLSMAILRTAWRLCHLELSFICFLFGSFLVSVSLFFFRCRYFIHGQSASLLHNQQSIHMRLLGFRYIYYAFTPRRTERSDCVVHSEPKCWKLETLPHGPPCECVINKMNCFFRGPALGHGRVV